MGASPPAKPQHVHIDIPSLQVLRQLELICKSKTFAGQGNAEKILGYIVAETLEGRVPKPKGIALAALGKKAFDRGDSQVRVETGILRDKLKEYYANEAQDDEIWFDLPPRQYSVFWRHSPKTLLGRTEAGFWVISAAKLNEEYAQRAAETASRFWPQLSSAFPIYCYEPFSSSLENGTLKVPDLVKMFFDSIGNDRFFLTTPDRAEVRIYPLNVWLAEWARLKSSEDIMDSQMLGALEQWGASGVIENRTSITIHERLLKQLNVPVDRSRSISISFHPNGYLRFEVDKPVPKSPVKCSLYLLRNRPSVKDAYYCYLLVDTNAEQDFLGHMKGDIPVNLETIGYMIAFGEGEPPEGLEERLLAKYDFVLTKPLAPPG